MNRRQFLKAAAAGGLGIAGGARVYGAGLDPADIDVSRVTLGSRNLPASFHGLKIVFLSDLHHGSAGVHTDLLERALEMAAAAQPDIICFGGDLITGWSGADSLKEFLAMARGIQAPLGVYACMGNHEFLWGETNVMREFERSSIRLLRNETVTLKRGEGLLPLIGIDNLYNQKFKSVQDRIRQIESQPASLVLEHTPDIAPLFGPDFSGVLLCGHTHGGQIRLPLIGQAMSSSRYGLRYVAGLYPVAAGSMYVTRGVGAVLFPARIMCPPEVAVIELSPEQEIPA